MYLPLVVIATLLHGSSAFHPSLSLLARVGTTISILQLDAEHLRLNSSTVLFKAIEPVESVFITVDERKNTGYFTSKHQIRLTSLDGNPSLSQHVLQGVLHDTPTSVAYDWLTHKLYVAISSGFGSVNRIEVCQDPVEGEASKCSVIIHDGLDALHSLVLDPVDGNMYWINDGQNKIERAFMNGRHHDRHPFQKPVLEEGAKLSGLALSRQARSLFYVRSLNDRSEIWKCRLYERNSCVHLVSSTPVSHIEVFEDLLFIALTTGKLEICEWAKCNETRVEVRGVVSLDSFALIPPYRFNESAENPCAVKNGGCSYICVVASIQPRRTCACPIGVQMKEDDATCEDSMKEASYFFILLVSALSGLFYISLDTKDYTPHIIKYPGFDEKTHHLFDVDYDPVEKFIYWLDVSEGKIRRGRLNATETAVVAREGVSSNVKSIRLDVVGRNIFWIDEASAMIWVGKMDGSIPPRILVGSGLAKPHGLGIDHIRGRLYISDWSENNGTIIKMHLDGTNMSVLYQLADFAYPTGVEFDHIEDRIYWAESNQSLIRSVRLDGSELQTYMHSSNKLIQPFRVSKLGNRIYCNSMAGRSIAEVTLKDGVFTGHASSVIVESQIYGPLGIKAFNTTARARIGGPCAHTNGGCQHYCFNTPKTNDPVCACARGYELDIDGRNCTRPAVFALFLDHRHPQDVHRISVKGLNNHERLFTSGIRGSAYLLAYDPVLEMFYVGSKNTTSAAIYRVAISETPRRAETVVDGSALLGLSSIAVDSSSGNVYWTNSELGRVEVAEPRGVYRKTIAWQNLRPTLITLHQSKKLIFVVDEREEIIKKKKVFTSAILYMPYTGHPDGGEVIINSSAKIVSLTLNEKTDALYWVEQNGKMNTLYQAKLNGDAPTILSQTEDRRLYSIVFLDHILYYVDNLRGELGFYNSHGFQFIHDLGGAGAMTIAHSFVPPKAGPDKCNHSYGGCSQLCFSTSSPSSAPFAHCACRDHYELDAKTGSCIPPTNGVLIASTGRLMRLNAVKNGDNVESQSLITVLPIERVGHPLSLCTDLYTRANTIYWIDATESRKLKAVNGRVSTSTIPHMLEIDGCTQLWAVTVDEVGRQLFVSCSGLSGRMKILALRIEETNQHPNRLSNIGKVLDGDEINPLTGLRPRPSKVTIVGRRLAYLDIADRSGSHHLIVCNLNGKQCKKGSESTNTFSQIAALPTIPLLFFTTTRSISTLNTDYQAASLIHLSIPLDHQFFFAPLDINTVAYTEDSAEGGHSIRVREMAIPLPVREFVTAMAVFASPEERERSYASGCARPECTHLCSPLPDGLYDCMCPLGFTNALEAPSVCLQNITCEPWQFLCRDQRTCIHSGMKCDHHRDCPDGSDEATEECSSTSSSQFRCADGVNVIDRYRVCDGFLNCPDGSDERGCKCPMPSVELDCAVFGRMADAECVQRRLRCDHHRDCANGADEEERLCTEFPPDSPLESFSFPHVMWITVAIMIFFVLLLVCIFCIARRRSGRRSDNVPSRGFRYHSVSGQEPSALASIAEQPERTPSQRFEIPMQAYSVAGSSSTYPSLPAPLPSLSMSGYSSHHDHGVDKVSSSSRRSPLDSRHHVSRFYAPPPSAASLSTYGIGTPMVTEETLRRAPRMGTFVRPVRTSSQVRVHEISPPPAYAQSIDQRRNHSQASQLSRSQARPTAGSVSSSSSSAMPSQRKKTRPRKDPTPSVDESSSDESATLSSHSSEQDQSGYQRSSPRLNS